MSDNSTASGIDVAKSVTSNLGNLEVEDKAAPALAEDLNPLEPYRVHIAQLLSKISDVSESVIYPAVQWTSGLDKGDLILAVPAMRIKGGNPAALAQTFAESVSQCLVSRLPPQIRITSVLTT